MNTLTLLSFLIFCSVSRASSFLDFSELDNRKHQNEYFKNEGPHSASLEDSDENVEFRMRQSSDPNSSIKNQALEDQRRGNFPDIDSNSIAYQPNELIENNEVPDEKPMYEYFPFYSSRRHYLDNIYENSPIRRQVKEWKVSDNLLDSNIPWIDEAYYPKSGQNERMIDSNYPENNDEDGAPLMIAGDYADPRETSKLPQYYQKNYYYNYYPLMQHKKSQREEVYDPEEAKRNLEALIGRRKNPCRHYLEFLKYAFDKLDEDPEYNYSPNEDYIEAFSKEAGKPAYAAPPLGAKLLGPTFYVDNSGKISQVNTNSNSVQMIEGVSPDTKISVFSKTVGKPSPSTITPSVDQTTLNVYNEDEWTEPTIPEEKHFPKTSTESSYSTTTEGAGNTETTTFELGGRSLTMPIYDKFPLNNDIGSNSNSPWSSKNHTSTPHFIEGNLVKSKTVVSFKNFTDDVDCNDKMLPCPDTVNITYPLNGYCNRYVTCESGRAIRRTCPEGLHFNVVIKGCDLPHNSICTYTCPRPNGLFGIPGDCGGYFSCKNSNLEYRMCPPRMHWDINRNTCIFSELSTCPMNCTKSSDVKPYDGDCKAYVICLNSIPYYHRCPPNTKFSKQDLTCVPSSSSQCEDDPRLVTEMMNPNTLCKGVQLTMNTNAWCRSFLNLK